MLSLFGNSALTLATAATFLQVVLPLIGYAKKNPYLMAFSRPSLIAHCFFVFIAYCVLTTAFVTNDFSISYVAANSHPDLPLMYRLTAIWGGHEGSILLWILNLSCWSIALMWGTANDPDKQLQPLTISLIGVISFLFLCFLLFTSNPFAATSTAQTARDLNPLLQDAGFIIHPPMLYAGYVGFSAAFALTLAALLRGRFDASIAKRIRQFAIAAWCFLTGGIALGSWWAYRVLGWGGFWFWDPVENASLLPWLSGTALIHILLLTETRNSAKQWAAILAIITFALSLLGTFLVRSGVLVSAHTFASDPARGIFLLALFSVVLTAALIILTLRLPAITNQSLRLTWRSRDMALITNSLLLTAMMLTVLLGTLYPLLLEAFHLGTISVGAPYFNAVMMPFMLIALVLMALIHLLLKRQISFQHSKAMFISHAGFAIMIIGIILSTNLHQERIVRMRPGMTANVGPYQFFFVNTEGMDAANYQTIRARFDVIKNKHPITTLFPEKRIYTVREMIMTTVAIHPGIFRDLYIALGEPLEGPYWSVRLYYKPFVRWIWFGAILMVIGGITSLVRKKGKTHGAI